MLESRTCGSAPSASNARTRSTSPSPAARCSAVRPVPSLASTLLRVHGVVDGGAAEAELLGRATSAPSRRAGTSRWWANRSRPARVVQEAQAPNAVWQPATLQGQGTQAAMWRLPSLVRPLPDREMKRGWQRQTHRVQSRFDPRHDLSSPLPRPHDLLDRTYSTRSALEVSRAIAFCSLTSSSWAGRCTTVRGVAVVQPVRGALLHELVRDGPSSP